MCNKKTVLLMEQCLWGESNLVSCTGKTFWALILCLTISFQTNFLFAQSEEAPTSLLSTEAPTLRFEHLKVGDGLAQGSANFITQDSQGYIWISTQSGLHRYDGYEFKVYEYTAFDSTSLSEGWVWQVDESENGDLWVATNSSGVNRMDRATGTFKHYMHDPEDSTSLSSNWTRFILEDSRGDLWVTTENDGLNRMQADDDGHFQRFRHVYEDSSTITSNNLFFIDEDSEGNIWIGSVNGLNRINPETNEITRFLFDPDTPERYGAPGNVLGIHHSPDEPGIHWLTSGNGLVRLNSNTGDYDRFLIEPNNGDNVNPLNLIHEIVPDPNLEGVFWVAGPGTGVARFDVRTEEFTTYRNDPRDPNSLAEDYAQSIFADRSGTMWVGFTTEGMSSFNPGAVNFSHFRHNPDDPMSLSPGMVWGVYEDRFGTLWAGTDAGPTTRYLTQYDPADGIVKYHQHDPNDTNTLLPGLHWKFAEDEDDRFWVAGNVGLSRLNRETGEVTRFRQDEGRNNNIFDLEPTFSDGNQLWIANAGGLDLFDTETETFTKVNVAPEGWEFEPVVIDIYEDAENQIMWLGTAAGLVRFDMMTSTSEAFSYNQSDTTTISDNIIFGVVAQDSDPTILWLATQSSGLNRFDTKTNTATHFTKADGLADNHIYGLLKDENGTLWMSSNDGITNFDPETFAIRNYGLDDGLLSLEYNQNAYFKNSDGVLYFGGPKGVTAFLPEQLKINETPPQVVLSDFKLFNRSVAVGPDSPLKKALAETETITLDYNQNEITFDYTALHFANSNRNRYQYQLAGFDEDWVDVGNQRSATYTNLAPGDYIFRVKASNSDGVWNEKGTSVNLSILPPWYQTWWAYVLFAGIFGFMVFGVDQTQRKRLNKKERERSALREAELRAEAENKRRSDTEQLSKIGQTITSTLSVDEIIETVYENVNVLMDAAIFGVGIYNKHKNSLDFPATKEKGKMLPAYSYGLDENSRLAIWCFKNKKEIIIGDFANEYTKYVEEYKQPIEGDFSDSVIYLPLIHQAQVIGVITTQSFKKNAYTEYHINLLRNLATYAAIALDNASAYRQLNATLNELKTTQNQLVQQEKLASLGQLTAGIAHEIKNPLNFVNNFSDLSIELVEEAKEEVKRQKADVKRETKDSPFEGGKNDKGVQGDDPVSDSETESHSSNTPHNPLPRGEAESSLQSDLILEILNDIEANLRKIYEHGTRADGIVKSMLQHSRGGEGKLEPTDLNALIKEYANLAFHGMRAAKNPINVDIQLDLDENIGEVDLISEDFSRVILNLCNNAFDAMREKLSVGSGQLTNSPFEGGKDGEAGQGDGSSGEYKPKLTVRTKRTDKTVTIEIQDNGPGIPEDLKEKILQPFFTTKKGTAGTGLGLSITNDIIKAHGGILKIDSQIGEKCVFTIILGQNDL